MKSSFWKPFRRKRSVSRNERAEKYSNTIRIRTDIYKGLLPRLGLALVFIVCTILLFPPTQRTKEVMFKQGDIADRDIIAPFDFQVPYSEDELRLIKSKAALQVMPVYVRDALVETSLTHDLSVLLDSLGAISRADTLTRDQKLEVAANLLPYLSKNMLKVVVNPSNLGQISKAAREYQQKFFERGLIDHSGPLRGADFPEITVLDGIKETRRKAREVVDQGRLDQILKEEGALLYGKNWDKVQVFFEIVRAYLQPNLKLDAKETQRKRDLASEQVPKYYVVSKNERIIGKHDKVTAEQENELKALEKMRASLQAKESPVTFLSLYTAEVIRLVLFILLFGGYLFIFHPKIYRELLDLTALLCVFLMFVVFMGVVIRFAFPAYLIPAAFVSLMVTALFDYRLGLVATVFASFLMSLVAGVPATVGFVSVLAGTAAVVGLLKMRSRSHFYSVFLYITLAYVVGISSLELGRAESFREFYTQVLWALGNSLFSSLSVMFLLPIFETIFNLTTRFTLLELTDLNKPILKRLNMEAPGTYHHSMLLGSLVDSVAGDVGADSLKARVMAYYHDIGKIFKPEYYGENQEAGFNKHEKITPQMSGLILLSHVKDGVELAREEKLPQLVIDAVREHHGTTVMAYFYQKALETDSHSSVNKDDFRYPGPRPSTKESALLMLADTVEPACRSLKDPTSTHIRHMVIKLIDSRAQEGELDESGLTLNDLARSKEKFISILTGIYHKRVAYPGQEKEEEPRGEAVAKSL